MSRRSGPWVGRLPRDLLVGTIGGAAKAGLTVALKFPSPELPQIGYHGRSDIYPIGDCTEPDPTDAERYQRPNPFQPPQEECKKLLAAYQKFTAEHLARFERVLRINLVGTFNCLRLAAAAMSKTAPVDADGARGAIVNIASVAAFDGQIGQAAYSASKGGVVGLTLPVARDLSAIGVRVNTVAPGLIDTPIYGTGEGSEKFKAHLGKDVLFPKRLGDASEIASMVFELITNPYMNAEVIRVDGGIRIPPK